jgi:ParB family transcriptional regulator, chromosome partitioning protein
VTALAALCTCFECLALDREHPREGRQIALIRASGGEHQPAADHPDAPAVAPAGVRVPEGRTSRDTRSRPPTAESETPMNAQTKIASADAAAPVPPSTLTMVAFRDLKRAPENVRKTAIDADVDSLAENIAAVGLLQSLIGYRHGPSVMIVGGGRRLQALGRLCDEFRIGIDFEVPVLIRDRDEAIELSLAENLERRDMNPADEFEAFRLLMEPGTRSPADIAKRFGMTERYVKQRLRLAELAPEILDGLREGAMTIEGALAYARTPDIEMQRQVFAAQKRRAWDKHDPRSIRQAVTATKTTNWGLYRYIGAAAYERAGGGYDEGLFDDDASGEHRRLSNRALVEKLALDHIEFQMLRRQHDMAAALELEAVFQGYVVYPDIEFPDYGMSPPKPPESFAWVGNAWDTGAVRRMLNTVRNNGVAVRLLVGVQKGELVAWDRGFFVDKAQKNAVQPDPTPIAATPPPTPEEFEASERRAGIELWAKRLAIGSFAGTPLEGRAFWPDNWAGRNPDRKVIDGQSGWWVPLLVFVADEEVAAQTAAAADRYDRARLEAAEAAEARARAAEQASQRNAARQIELEAMDPPPAVIVVDGEAWGRDDEGAYVTIDDAEDGWLEDWSTLLDALNPAADPDHRVYATRAEFDAAHAAAQPDEVTA